MRRLFASLATARPWKQTLHLLLDLPLGIAWFTWVVTMLSLGGGLAVTVIGIPLLALTVTSGRWIGSAERARARLLLDDDAPAPSPFRSGQGWLALTKAGLVDGPGWKGLAYGALMLPWGIVTFTVAVTIWSTALGLLATPILWASLPDRDLFQFGDHYVLTGWARSVESSARRSWGWCCSPSSHGSSPPWPRATVGWSASCCRPTPPRCSPAG